MHTAIRSLTIFIALLLVPISALACSMVKGAEITDFQINYVIEGKLLAYEALSKRDAKLTLEVRTSSNLSYQATIFWRPETGHVSPDQKTFERTVLFGDDWHIYGIHEVVRDGNPTPQISYLPCRGIYIYTKLGHSEAIKDRLEMNEQQPPP